jgi:hypothetical protein
MTKPSDIWCPPDMKATAIPHVFFSSRSVVILSLLTQSIVKVELLVILRSFPSFIDCSTSGLEVRSSDLIPAGFLVFYFREQDSRLNLSLQDGFVLVDL